jgi:hypothetical protein
MVSRYRLDEAVTVLAPRIPTSRRALVTSERLQVEELAALSAELPAIGEDLAVQPKNPSREFSSPMPGEECAPNWSLYHPSLRSGSRDDVRENEERERCSQQK